MMRRMSHTDANLNLDYIRKHYAVQDDLLASIDAKLHDIGMPIHIGPEEGKLLQLFIGLHGVKTIIEVGTLAGYSTIWMARALGDDGHIYTLNKDPEHIALAKDSFARSDVADRITMLEGDARELLPTLEGRTYDMMFIDADKIGYNDYLDWAEKLVRPGGLIVADNTFLFGTIGLDTPPEGFAPTTWHLFKLFGQRLADPSRYFSTIIPTDQGMTVAVKLF